MNDHYPFSVKVKKDHNWWSDRGSWYELSTWCNETFGVVPAWEFGQISGFLFKTESDKLLFALRWGDHPVIKGGRYETDAW
jgi:hypothetical protein